MRRILHLSVILLSCVILTSCSTASKVPAEKKTSEWDKAWVGKSYSQIADKFGLPETVVTDGRDGQILVYDGISVDRQGGDHSARFYLGSDGICSRVVPGAPLSSRDGAALADRTYGDEYEYEDGQTSGMRSMWSFILDNAFNILFLISLAIWIG